MRRHVLRLAVPAAFKHFLDIVQVLIDLVMVGSLGAAAVAAVGISMQFLMMLQVVMTLYTVGAGAVISRYIGSKRRNRASSVVFGAFIIALPLSIVVGWSGWTFNSVWFGWMGSSQEVVELGENYFGTISLGMSLIFLDALAYGVLSSAGDTHSAVYIKILSACLNGLLNYLWIFGHGGFEAMGVAGAAYATLCAYAFNLTIYAWLLFRKGGVIDVIAIVSVMDIRRIMKIGFPAAYERAIGSMSFMFFVTIIGSYGTHAMAGYQIGLRVEALAFMPGFGFSVAAMALAGQNIGARKWDDAYDSGLYSAKIAMVFMGSVGIVLVMFPEFFVGYFTDETETLQQASLYLRWVGMSQIPLAIMFVFSGALRGAGATRTTLKINTLSLWLFRIIPSYAVMSFGFEIVWIYIAMTIETFIKGGWFWKVYRQRKWLNTSI